METESEGENGGLNLRRGRRRSMGRRKGFRWVRGQFAGENPVRSAVIPARAPGGGRGRRRPPGGLGPAMAGVRSNHRREQQAGGCRRRWRAWWRRRVWVRGGLGRKTTSSRMRSHLRTHMFRWSALFFCRIFFFFLGSMFVFLGFGF